ncbi:MAG TPA: valine--tRNA ligase [Gemmatimonadales bacterium]|jgi:valyl-tRNA synthetase|nr:valine--tRNA ligase [Gemmatimonadales bacterium]
MTEPLAPQYNPSAIESALYAWWQERGLFAPAGSGAPYVVMMPPPNVTAVLHMGHGLNNTVQDVLVRFERMRGRRVLWLPGTDHAGIATQNVVERLLAKEGLTRFDVGRDAFVERVWAYVDQTGSAIIEQLKAIGASADWSRTYFTLDEDLSRAVREAFVSLYEAGLVYRGHYIINWCPRCLTALSNEEAEKEETDGKLWHLRYPLADGSGHVTVATTRPETMLGDTGVAVHPEDERYRHLVGRELLLPVVGRRVPIVADDAVDPAFGSGAVKVTPAHDPADFEIGRRHGLPSIDVMTPDARISLAAPDRFQGLDRFEARTRVVAEFEAAGLLERVEPHRHAVGHCYRCDTVIEPRLSEQWFVRMEPLARPALAKYRDGTLHFIPERRGDDYTQWLEGIRDWCISRQLWWGHRIPVWYCQSERCARITVSRTDVEACPACGGAVRQDEDVLDTWFSSWLVPFSSLGWPDRTADLATYYPGHTLVSAPEILFFWVARMIMSGLYFMGEVPYTHMYLHGTVRDTQHRKMSKSLGNGIDPLEVVERYGADALRYSLVSGMSVGTDVILDPNDLEASFAAGRNFANKLWNAGRFILSNLDRAPRPLAGAPRAVRRDELTLADRWIIARCEATVREATEAYEKFRLNEAAGAVYRFLWSDLADWYIEQIKPRLYGDVPGGDVARAVATQTFDVALRLLHPVMPFVTEALWRRFPGRPADASISIAPWPRPDARAVDAAALADFGLVQQVVGAIRAIRAEYGVQPGQTVRAYVAVEGRDAAAALEREGSTIVRLAKLSELILGESAERVGGNAVLPDGTAVFVPLGDAIDVGRECTRLGAESDRLAGLVASQEKKLGNQQFVSRAPADVVAREREKLTAWTEQRQVLIRKRELLGCG